MVTKTTLVLANTPITNGFTYEKRLSMLKDEIQKGIHLKTPQDRNYWHFPCVMLCTLPFVVQLQYILQYVKHLKCESGNNSTNQWQFWQQQQNCCSLPVSCLNMHNFSTRVFIEVWGLSLAIHSRRDSSCLKKMSQLQLDIFSAFYVLFYLWLLKAPSQQFCNLCSHKLNGCHLNNYYWGLKPFWVAIVQLRRCRRIWV